MNRAVYLLHKLFKTNTYWKTEIQKLSKFKIGQHVIHTTRNYKTNNLETKYYKIVDIDVAGKKSGVYSKLVHSSYVIRCKESGLYDIADISQADGSFELDMKAMNSEEFQRDLEEIIHE